MKTKNLLIVDEQVVVRKGLKVILSDFFEPSRIYEADDGKQLFVHFKERKIDVLIMDVQMPNTDSIGIVEYIAIKFPQTYIMIFSMLPERIYGPRLLKAGACGYLAKESSLDEMMKAFNHVSRSKKYISASLREVFGDEREDYNRADPFSKLSYREFEIVNFLLSGVSVNSIAATLNLKPSTIGTYKSRLFEKLKVNNVFEIKDLAVLYKLASRFTHGNNAIAS
jgi:two-component system, NarL family, invasion response regulator UvrY